MKKNKENKKEKNDAQLAVFILTDINIYNNKYINISKKDSITSSNPNNKKEDATKSVASRVIHKVFTDYIFYKDNNYVNIIKKSALTLEISEKKEAQMEIFILADINIYNNNNYISLFIYIDLQRLAPEAQLEVYSSHKRGLSGHSGSIPGWGASAPNFSLIKSIEKERI